MSVLVCYDGSPSARNAIANVATLLPQRTVTLLHVWNPPLAILPDSFSDKQGPAGPSTKELNELSEKRAGEILEDGRLLAQQHGIEAHTLTAANESSLTDTILRVADEQDSAVIVLGAHPHGTPGPSLESTSAAVFARSHRAVLVVPMSDRPSPEAS